MPVPKYYDLFNPLLTALHQLGGSASVAEQEDAVATLLKLTDAEVAEIHRGNTPKLTYRLAWARNYLKRFGLLENSARGVWALTPKGSKTHSVEKEEVNRFVKRLTAEGAGSGETSDSISSDKGKKTWQEELIETIRSIPPAAFERLCQRLLRESGFIHVEVIGRSGDGGIDGKGVVRIGGLLSFHVRFQCKRYKGTVSPSFVRDFRGAISGRADKGLLITTGKFSREARAEAQRDGATPIDLIDGEELVEKLRQLRIGVQVKERIVEDITITAEYFATL